MIRITNTTNKRHKNILKLAKGMSNLRKNNFSVAKQAVQHKLSKQTIARKLLKRNMRRVWIQRINAFVRMYGITYSKFIQYFNGYSRKALSDKISYNPMSIQNQIQKIMSN